MLLRKRIIPVLLLQGRGLVKTKQFSDPVYIGDPVNAVKIFNEKEVDELILLDISDRTRESGPDFDYLREIASECFMPLCYGGGIRSTEDIRKLLRTGVEKVAVNTRAANTPDLIEEAAKTFGSSTLVVSIDVKKDIFGRYSVVTAGGKRKTNLNPEKFAVLAERLGAGELLVQSVDRDGIMKGYDTALLKKVVSAVGIPVVACGGAGSIKDIDLVFSEAGVSAAAAGSIFVFKGKHRAVLINYPERSD